MKKIILIVIAVLAVVTVFYALGTYNRLVSQNENIDTQWAQVETQYQRRFDLIPNLVEAVKGVLTQEQEVFGMIADARTRYAGAQTVSDKVSAANELESALGRLLVIMENYPQLNSSKNVEALQVQLEGTENRISVERQRFNDAIRDYNLIVKRFPGSLMANLFGFGERAYFEAAEGAEEAPQVDLNLDE